MTERQSITVLNEDIRQKATAAIRKLEEQLWSGDETWVWNNLFFKGEDGGHYATLHDIAYKGCTTDAFRTAGPYRVTLWQTGIGVSALLQDFEGYVADSESNDV